MIDFVLRPLAGLLLCVAVLALLVSLPFLIRVVRSLLRDLAARREAAESAKLVEPAGDGVSGEAADDPVGEEDEPVEESVVADDVDQAHRRTPPHKRQRESA